MLRISTDAPSRSLRSRFQALDGRLVVADEEPLHVRVAQDDSTPPRPEIGFGTGKPHELVVWVEPSTIWAPVPLTISASLGRVRDLKISLHRPLHRKIADPDRAKVGTEPVRPARLFGFEDRRRQEYGPIEVAPAYQGVLGIEPRECEQSLHRGWILGERARQRAARLLDIKKPLASPVGIDRATVPRKSDHLPSQRQGAARRASSTDNGPATGRSERKQSRKRLPERSHI